MLIRLVINACKHLLLLIELAVLIVPLAFVLAIVLVINRPLQPITNATSAVTSTASVNNSNYHYYYHSY